MKNDAPGIINIVKYKKNNKLLSLGAGQEQTNFEA